MILITMYIFHKEVVYTGLFVPIDTNTTCSKENTTAISTPASFGTSSR